jgi:hypothetical protein
MNKTIKKIVALGMGATMLAGTAAMALATDLSDYPSPFVKDSVFVGKIVIGEKAAAIDVLGATDIAASLQREAAVGVTGSAGSMATATDGYHFKESEVLIYGETLPFVGIGTLTDDDLPKLLASGMIEADDGTEYDYDVEISVANSLGVVSGDITGDLEDEGYTDPVIYFDLTPGAFYEIIVDFQDTWDAEDFLYSETIELFDQQYTFGSKNDNDDDVLTLYGSETTMLVSKGGTETVQYNGKSYTLEVLGGNSDSGGSAIVRINGDTRTVKEGDSRTIGGLPIYVKNLFVSNIGGDDVSVQFFVGSDKLELDYSDNTVTKNGVELEGVEFTLDSTLGWTGVKSWTFTVTPSDMDDEIDYILPGGEFVDPVFDAFKFAFVGATDLKAGKEAIHFLKSGKKLNVEFTPRKASGPVSVNILDNDAVNEYLWADLTDMEDVPEKTIFFYNDNVDPTKAVTHVLQVTSIKDGHNASDPDFQVVVKDLSHGKTYTATRTDRPLSTDVAIYIAASSGDSKQINFVDSLGNPIQTELVLYTNAGASITLSELTVAANVAFVVEEDEDLDADTTALLTTSFVVTQTWDPSDYYEFSVIPGGMTALDDENDDVDFYISEFGTYVEQDVDKDAYVKVYVPHKEVSYDMFLMPLSGEVVVSSTSTGGAVALNPISVGMAILDSEASLGTKPYIVVGGPCANTVAAALMGNTADCAAGFTEGKAMIKLYSARNALLVAGYSGKDTQGASRVLANYKDYGFAGNELEVTTANLNSLSVKKLS